MGFGTIPVTTKHDAKTIQSITRLANTGYL